MLKNRTCFSARIVS